MTVDAMLRPLTLIFQGPVTVFGDCRRRAVERGWSGRTRAALPGPCPRRRCCERARHVAGRLTGWRKSRRGSCGLWRASSRWMTAASDGNVWRL